jgi:predicted dehydrogenase
VYSEKPLALTREEGFELVEFTRKQGVRLACAPAVHLGDIQETAWRFLETGALGKVRLVFAEVNQGRIETWHPAPEPIYQVGPILDIGVYAITLTTAMFGPIQRVRAFSTTIMPERQTKEGRKFTLDSPDFYQIIFEMRNGIIFRLNANYYADMGEKQSGYEVHGDLGSLYLSSWHNYDGTVEFRPYGDRVNYQPVPLIRPAFIGPKRVELCRGLDSFASSIRYDKPQLVQGAHAAHVLDASLAAHESARIQAPVEVKSTFIQPSLSLIEDLA